MKIIDFLTKEKVVKKLFFIAMLVVSTIATAQTWVDGYMKRDGTYVQGHWKSDANEYRFDNRSSRTNGGTQRDEYSDPPAYNRSNPLSGYQYEAPKRKCYKDAYGMVSCY